MGMCKRCEVKETELKSKYCKECIIYRQTYCSCGNKKSNTKLFYCGPCNVKKTTDSKKREVKIKVRKRKVIKSNKKFEIVKEELNLFIKSIVAKKAIDLEDISNIIEIYEKFNDNGLFQYMDKTLRNPSIEEMFFYLYKLNDIVKNYQKIAI